MHQPSLVPPVVLGVVAGLLVAVANPAWDITVLAALGVVAFLVVITGR